MPVHPANETVTLPLTPSVLEEIGVIGEFPKSSGFDPKGDWSHTYRLWLCHGFYGQLNLDVACLRIDRKTSAAKGRFTLAVEQKAVNWEGIVQTISADIVCSNDSISTPLSWTCTSAVTDTAGNDRLDLTTKFEGRFDDGGLEVSVNGTPSIKRNCAALSSDWCLFDAVQRMPLIDTSSYDFDILEGMTAFKESQRLRYRKGSPDGFVKRDEPLSSFVQVGAGILPYEYWLGKDNRLLLVCSGDRAYILDGNAETTFNRELDKHRGGGYSWQNKL